MYFKNIKLKKILTSSLVTASLFGSFGIGYLTSHLVEKNNNLSSVSNDFETDFIENGIKLSRVNAYTTENGESVQEVSYSFEPANPFNKGINSYLQWGNSNEDSDTFYRDKIVEDYVTYEINEETQIITITCLQPFETRINLQIRSIENNNASAEIHIDYATRYNFVIKAGDATFSNSNNIELIQDIEEDTQTFTDGLNSYSVPVTNDSFGSLNLIIEMDEVIQYGSKYRELDSTVLSEIFNEGNVYESKFNCQEFYQKYLLQFVDKIYGRGNYYSLIDTNQYFGDDIDQFLSFINDYLSGNVDKEKNIYLEKSYISTDGKPQLEYGFWSTGNYHHYESITGNNESEKYNSLITKIVEFGFAESNGDTINDRSYEMFIEIMANALANIDTLYEANNDNSSFLSILNNAASYFKDMFVFEIKPSKGSTINGFDSVNLDLSFRLYDPFRLTVQDLNVNNSNVIY